MILRTSLLVLLFSNVVFSLQGLKEATLIQDNSSCYHVPLVNECRTAFDSADNSSWYKLWKYTFEALKQACFGNFAIINVSFTSNFDVVVPGILYRSAQPSADDIDQYVKAYKIRTILNLRNEIQTQEKYQELWKGLCAKVQQWALKGAPVSMINIPLDNMTIIDPNILQKILEIIENIKDGVAAPALIHCESGSGRTGLVCALYRIEAEEATLEQALDELDPYSYFHIEELYPNVKHFVRIWFDLRRNKGLDRAAALESYKKIYSGLSLITTT